MKGQIIKTNGRVKSVKPFNSKNFNIKELQSIVDGYIEIVKTRDNRIMVVNEEAKNIKLPYNEIATNLYVYGKHQTICGDVIVMDKAMMQ
jgi:hypothetical protein